MFQLKVELYQIRIVEEGGEGWLCNIVNVLNATE